MGFVVIQGLTGLAGASSLFLVAAGLTVIFGVTRVVNFAHGSLYMLGAYVGVSVLVRLPGTIGGFALGVIGAACAVGLAGVLMEVALLRRIYRAPPLLQLLATFGVVLIVQDFVQRIWGPDDLTLPRPPWLRGFVVIAGSRFPVYDLALIAVGPLVLAALWLLLTRTRWGTLVRAATQDREMVAALGVDQRWLFTSVFALGAALAGLGGALALPDQSANLQMDLGAIVDAFVIVVVGGLGSLPGAYLAALVIALLQAYGLVLVPRATLVLAFLVMAVVLMLRPNGLLGRPLAEARVVGGVVPLVRPAPLAARVLGAAALAAAIAAPFFVGAYGLSVLTEAAVAILFAASLHFIMGPGGLPSFGHAAWFGLGAYAAGLIAVAHAPMLLGLAAAPLLAGVVAALLGGFTVRLSGVYLAMITLAFAQIVWAVAFQWVEVTGGDNGMLNVWPARWAGHAGGVLLAGARPLHAGDPAAAPRALCPVRLRVAGGARFRPAGGGDRAGCAAAAHRRLRHRRGRGGAVGWRVRLRQGQRVPLLRRYSALGRCAADGAAGRRAEHGRADRRRARLYRPLRLAVAKHRSVAAGARLRDRAAGRGLPRGHRRGHRRGRRPHPVAPVARVSQGR